jgi:hypothetical protein
MLARAKAAREAENAYTQIEKKYSMKILHPGDAVNFPKLGDSIAMYSIRIPSVVAFEWILLQIETTLAIWTMDHALTIRIIVVNSCISSWGPTKS